MVNSHNLAPSLCFLLPPSDHQLAAILLFGMKDEHVDCLTRRENTLFRQTAGYAIIEIAKL